MNLGRIALAVPTLILLPIIAKASHFSPPSSNSTRQILLAHGMNSAKVRVNDFDWKIADQEVVASKNLMGTHPSNSPDQFAQSSVLRDGPQLGKKITLTFDDGPHPIFTGALIKILKEEHVPATFFVVGFMADQNPDLVRNIKSAGFEVANHTYSHVTLTKIPAEQVLTEYQANNDVIKRLTGASARYCRPPGGDFNDNVLKSASELGMTTVLWTDDPGDYKNPGDSVLLEREVAKLEPGAIILLHDGSQNTLDTLREFIHIAKRKGYTFVGLDEMRK
jgi:peptidoglycan/xylan/chitin deacetylase (PgdA/CDA1 family)